MLQHLKLTSKIVEVKAMKVKDTISDIETNNSVIEIDNKLSFVKVETTGFQDLCNHIAELEEENKALTDQNQQLRFHRASLNKELQRIKKLGMFEFANEFCNDDELEDAGRQLARSLGVGK